MSIQVSYKKQIVFGIMFIITFLAIIELIANMWWLDFTKCAFEKNEIFENYDEKYKQKLCDEYYSVRTSGYYLIPFQDSETVHINSLGFRGKEFSISKPENTFRIFAIGGSTMFGSGASSDENTIPAYLQKLLDLTEFDFDVEVINAGISGGNSISEKQLITEKIINYNPDMLIIYDGWNDLRADYQQTLTKNNWKFICELGTSRNFIVILTLQPIAGFGNKILTEQEYVNTMNAKDHNGYRLLNKISLYEEYANALYELENICTITEDLRNVFDSIADPIYWDEGHIGDKGNEIVAKRLYDIIIPILSNTQSSSLNQKINVDLTESTGNPQITLSDKELKLLDEVDNKKNELIQFTKFVIDTRNAISFYKTPILIQHIFNEFRI